MTPRTLAAFCALIAVAGWAFLPTLEWMYGKWVTDPQYSHGFLVPLFSLFLLWQKRATLGEWFTTPRPIVGGTLLLLVVGMRFLAGGLLFHQLDALALLLTLSAMAVMIGGFRLGRIAAPAIVFLIFMIPLPYELERNVGGPLKIAATQASTFLLQTLGYPAIAEGNLILIDEVRLGVVDACSGLKMLVTFSAFAVGAVLLLERTRFEKLLILLGIVPIAMIANILRVTATGVSHTMFQEKETLDFLHDLYGWLMMPGGLALLGLQLWALSRLVVPPATSSELGYASTRPTVGPAMGY
ncbi:MAG: exosortase/archaeosortase family protein [Bacteroidales bacterium]|nr:exosortase/archaeosortase family protein [Bacteroidales bacterium]